MTDRKRITEHFLGTESGDCPVCGDGYVRAREHYSGQTTIISNDDERYCVAAGVASASPDPTLLIVYHG